MTSSKTKSEIIISWHNYREDIDPQLSKLEGILSRVTNIAHLNLYLYNTNLDDGGCATIGQILRTSQTIERIKFWFSQTKISDIGLLYLAPQLSSLPLESM
eukprot:TRINITY_DN21915_c0_g1_i2.p1 TRINITY_DN21915_c0_g1~~TRINITY_DN21915_c0_g1_i2.p1  ORF type:complete len:101 (-),score=3.39 TRINITY_DN21915_c0_g1_i2:129-431(-)